MGTGTDRAMVKDRNNRKPVSKPSNFIDVNGVLYFVASGRYSNSNTIRNFKKAAAQQPVSYC